MQIKVQLLGTMPLLMHNDRLADPSNEWTRKIAAITDKGKNMTDQDLQMKSRLEFEGGLYYSQANDGPYVPAHNLVRTLVAAGTLRRLGTKISQAVFPITTALLLQYAKAPNGKQGPRDVDGLWADGYWDRRMVGVNKNRVQRTRPAFPCWSTTADLLLLEDVLNPDDFEWACTMAGKAIGLGDARRIGMGRFEVKTEVAEP